jgi:hypothetical protein
MELPASFTIFLQGVRLTDTQKDNLKEGHIRLRDRLAEDPLLKDVTVCTFLQGSYRRSTGVRPFNSDDLPDVDIVVVTSLAKEQYSPSAALNRLSPFMEKHYKGKWDLQGRSVGIKLSDVKLDVVLTSAPSEAQTRTLKSAAVVRAESLDDLWQAYRLTVSAAAARTAGIAWLEDAQVSDRWKAVPLLIPDRQARVWKETHPLAQIAVTAAKNAATDGHFGSVVRALKWWRLATQPDQKHPKGYPLERLIGECCPDGVSSVAGGVAATLEGLHQRYAYTARMSQKPMLADYGVPTHDVLARLSLADFASFIAQVGVAATIARSALEEPDAAKSSRLWRELFGTKFPETPDNNGGRKDGFTSPKAPAVLPSGRFA